MLDCGGDDVGGQLNGVGCSWVGLWSRAGLETVGYMYVWVLCMHTSIAGSEFEIFSHVVTQRMTRLLTWVLPRVVSLRAGNVESVRRQSPRSLRP